MEQGQLNWVANFITRLTDTIIAPGVPAGTR